MKKEITNIIFTKDGNYAYNLRNKLESVKVKVDYVKDTEALLFFMFNNERGIIFIDLKYARFLPIIREYSNHQSSRNFCFVYLTDNKSCEVDCDNKLIFVTNYENLLPTVRLAMEEMETREKLKFTIPESFVENNLCQILKNLNISSKHAGYDLIKDAIKIMINGHIKPIVAMKDIYKEVGALRGKEPANVEKSIRLALTKAEEIDSEKFKKIFNNQRVSNTIILNYITETIKNSYYNSTDNKSKND